MKTYIGNTRYKILDTNGQRITVVKSKPYDAEIEYLESDGNQWIDTNFIPDDNSGLYIKAYANKYFNNAVAVGVRQTTGDTRWWINYSNGLEISWNSYIAYNVSYPKVITEVENNFLNSRTGKINGVIKRRTYPTLYNITNSAYLFNGNLYGTSIANPFIGRIYNVKFSRNDMIVMDMIPVRVGNVGYMYDKVSGQLFGNSGTGDFILGPDK